MGPDDEIPEYVLTPKDLGVVAGRLKGVYASHYSSDFTFMSFAAEVTTADTLEPAETILAYQLTHSDLGKRISCMMPDRTGKEQKTEGVLLTFTMFGQRVMVSLKGRDSRNILNLDHEITFI